MNMKSGIKAMMAVMIALAISSCRDRATEKRLADVESRLAVLEGNKTTQQQPAPVNASVAPTAVPDTKPEGPLPVIEFDKTSFDFGAINEGSKVTHTYQVKNTGSAPLVIQNAQPSCG